MNRQQRLQELEDLLKVRGIKTLQGKTVEELEKMLDESLLAEIRANARAQAAPLIAERQRKIQEINDESIWMRFFFKHPNISDNFANRKLLFDYALSLSDDGVVRFEHLAEAAKTVSGLSKQRVKQSPTAANLKQDEE